VVLVDKITPDTHLQVQGRSSFLSSTHFCVRSLNRHQSKSYLLLLSRLLFNAFPASCFDSRSLPQ